MIYNPLISVIMSVYKEPASYVKKAIASILNQTYSHIEFIIILDWPENTEVKELIKEMYKRDSRIALYENDSNYGLVYSLNKALSYCNGDYIARMDADDIAVDSRLEEELKYIQKNNLDLVGTRISKINKNDDIVSSDGNTYSSASVTKILKYTDCIPHPTWLARSDVFRILNGYRNIVACEDYDFLLRALEKGFSVGILNEDLLMYRENQNGISFTNTLVQTITTHILSKNRKRLSQYDLDVLKIVLQKYTSEDAKRHQKATAFLQKAANSNNIMKTIKYVLLSIVTSKYILLNYRQIIIKKLFLRIFS